MPNLMEGETSGKRWVLGFDGGCTACGELARRIEDRLAGRLEVLNLRDPQVEEWRKKALGENSPLVPTLFEIKGTEVRAWIGWRLGGALSRFLGPVATWRIMQSLGEMSAVPKIEESAVVEKLPEKAAETLTGLTRGQFLKGVGGAAVAMSVLSNTGSLVSPAEAVPRITGPATSKRDDVVGASIIHPDKWFVEREEHTFDETYGFTLWAPEPDSVEDHGGEPVIRVALAYGLRPGQVEARVRARIAEYSNLSMKREAVIVGARRFRGVAVGPIPGSTPSTEVYVPVEGRVYQINVYEPRLSTEGRRLLSNLRFERPSRSVESLGLRDGKKAETHQRRGDEELIEREKAARKEIPVDASREEAQGTPRAKNLSASPLLEMGTEYQTLEASAAAEAEIQTTNLAASVPYYNEFRSYEGCWVPTSTFFFQTQHGRYANGSGWARAGVPNYWGQYTHGNIGYGRCASTYYTNDKFAVDYPLRKWDVVFSPFMSGTVTFAGRNYTHKNYGIFVVIRADNGKYVNLSAHLSGVARGIYRGVRVTNASIIGYAGDTGDPSIPVGDPHLHQAYYRYPRYLADGSPYGGTGLQVIYHRYSGVPKVRYGGIYRFGWAANSTTKAKGSWISN